MVSGFAGSAMAMPMLSMGVNKLFDDDGVPPPAKDIYRGIYDSVSAVNGLEMWVLGKTYACVQCTGLGLSFLPAADNM